MKRTLVIGDVHGCSAELCDLLDACELQSSDEVVLVGDLVAKGPDSAGVLRAVRELDARAVLGNHDAHVLRCKRALDSGARSPRPGSEHERLARQLSEADLRWLAERPLWLRLPEHQALVVHAGIVPGVALEAQPRDALLAMRTLRPDGSPSSDARGGVLWGEVYDGPELVLFGHHAARGLQRHAFALGLDTGCVYGQALTACALPERRLVSVPARRAYAPIAGPSR